jgi:uncharacterized membrane protein YbhN (UPF0104 family)
VLALLLACGLLAWLLRHADMARLAAAALSLPWWTWAAATSGLATTYVLRAWRLRAEWSRLHPSGFLECLQIFLTHNAALGLLPMRSGEAGYLWLLNRRWGVSWAEAARSLLWLRLQDAFVLGVLAVAFLLPLGAPLRAALAGVPVLLALTAAPALSRAAGRRWPAVRHATSALLAHRADATGWACCIGNWLVKLAVLAALLAALMARMDPQHAFDGFTFWRGALGGELAGALPLQGPAGLGTYEAGVWVGAKLWHAEAPQIAAAALAVHAFSLAVSLVAAALVGAWVRRVDVAPSRKPV